MKRHLIIAGATLAMAIVLGESPAEAAVVRPAPDFLLQSSGGRQSNLKSLRGQPVVVMVAPSPRSGIFRKQVRYLEDLYRKFAAREVVFVAAFTETPGERAKSDIPFVYPVDPITLASSLGAGQGGYLLAVIGKDGNLDMVTGKVHAASYIESVINNSYAVQSRVRP